MIMKKTYLIFLIFSLLISFSVSAKNPTVSVEVIQSTDKYEKDKTYPVLFKLTVAKDWYIHSVTKEEPLIPTVLSFMDSEGLQIDNILFPEPEKKKFEYTDKPVDVYSGSFYIKGTVEAGIQASEGAHTIKGNLSYQACSEKSCLAPETVPVEVPITIVPAGTQTTEINKDLFQAKQNTETFNSKFDSGLFWALLWTFLGGLALNLTPCIYPLLSITVSYFGGKEKKYGGNVILQGILYISGLALTNSTLGAMAALGGSMLGAAQNQNPIVLIFVALIMVTLGFSFFGFWEIRVPGSLTKVASKNYRGYFGTFFIGLTLGIVAAPCIGPFVLGLLTYVGQKGDPFLGFLYFFVLSLGLGFPMLILAIFSSALDRLPRSGDWMVWVKKVLGWVLISMGYYFIRPLIPGSLINHTIVTGLAVISIIHLNLMDKTGIALKPFVYIKKCVSVIIIILLIYNLFSIFVSIFDFSGSVRWTPYNETILENAAKNSKPAIMDVYADWCGPCRLMDKRVFKNTEVIKLSENFIMTRLDITRKIQNQDEIAKKYSIAGAPTIIFFDKYGKEIPELRIVAEVDNDEFLSHMEKALISHQP